MRLFHRLRRTLFRRRYEADMAAEMQAHVEMETERRIATGEDPTTARRRAAATFGSIDARTEQVRDARLGAWLDQTWQDLRYAARGLRRSPLFTVIAVFSLAIGIGASTAIFSVLNAAVLRPLPVRDPGALREVHWQGQKPSFYNYSGVGRRELGDGFLAGSSFPYPALAAFQQSSQDLASLFALTNLPRLIATARNESSLISGLMVSGNFFPAYGATTSLGRPLTPDDDRPGAEPVVVITHRLWSTAYHLDPNVLGETLSLNRQPFTIVGVLPPDFVGPLPGDMGDCYVTSAQQAHVEGNRPISSLNHWWVHLMARLAPGTTDAQLAAALSGPFAELLADSKSRLDHPGIRLEDGAHGAGITLRRGAVPPLLALLGFIAVVLAVACANVGGLLLARGAFRQHEFAVRAAIGANRTRLLRQSFAESVLLSAVATGVGLLFAAWIKAALLSNFDSLTEMIRIDLHNDGRVLAFTLLLALFTALLFGLLPALRAARSSPLSGLKQSTALAAPRLRMARLLVTAQVGLSTLLVVAGGLLIRTFGNLVQVDPGFDAANVLLFRIDPARAGVAEAELGPFFDSARDAVATLPGVRSVALTSLMLASDSSSTDAIRIPGQAPDANALADINVLAVSEGYFETLGIPLLRGREFLSTDDEASSRVAVVNESFVRTYFPTGPGLGQTFVLSSRSEVPITIVGICRDAKYASMRDEIGPLMCFPHRQSGYRANKFIIRTALPPLALVPAARQALTAINPHVPIATIRTQEQLVHHSLAFDRLLASLCGGLAGLSLLLSGIGLYGLLAYNVARRTSEIGIRMALGANRHDIAGPIVRDALKLTVFGLVVGLPAGLGIAHLMRSQLYGIGPADPLTLSLGVTLLLMLTVLAAWLPARRATRLDPLTALRSE